MTDKISSCCMNSNEENAQTSMPKNMGIGLLGDPTLTFVRKFRWTLSGEGLSENLISDVKVDYFNRILTFKSYDVAFQKDGKVATGFDALYWAKSMAEKSKITQPPNNEKLTLKTYDGCGNVLYTIHFTGLNLKGHTSEFDYASSKVSDQCMIVRFDKWEIENRSKIVTPTVEPVKFPTVDLVPRPNKTVGWKLMIRPLKGGKDVIYGNCKVDGPPHMQVQEEAVTRMGVNTFRPLHQNWKKMRVVIPYADQANITSLIKDTRPNAFEVVLTKKITSPSLRYPNIKVESKVQWVLHNSRFLAEKLTEDETILSISYDRASLRKGSIYEN